MPFGGQHMAGGRASNVVQLRDVTSLRDKVSEEEWEARVDLAGLYRLVEINGWNSGIYNHASMRVPGEPDHFLIKAHPLLWREVTASNLVKVGMTGELDESAGVNRPGFVLHSAIQRARPDVGAVLHIHPGACIAVSVMKDGLIPLSQQSAFLVGQVGYHDYNGITEDADERGKIIAALGGKRALLMRSHGATTVGETPRHAYITMKHLIDACEIQLKVMASGAEVVAPSDEITRKTAKQEEAHQKGRGQDDWPAMLRLLDEVAPGYRE